MRWRADFLMAWAEALLRHAGADPPSAQAVAWALVEADLRGVSSHGLLRLPIYLRRLEAGLVNPSPRLPAELKGAVALLDGEYGFGPRVALRAVELAGELAQAHGLGAVGVRRSTHFGMAGLYAEKLAQRGFLALVTTNAEPDVVPFGGKEKALGTNPLAFAAPAPQGILVVDLATSESAMGKVFLAREKGERIPPSWGVDREGRPTEDPGKVYALRPLGGPKGYALALLVEVLSGVLTGAGVTHGIGRMYEEWDRPQDVGHFVLALDPGAFVGKEAFWERMGALWQGVKATPPAPGHGEVWLPGELEARGRAEAWKEGVELPERLVAELRALGDRYGVPWREDA
ncbi:MULTISPECIES: Ldh family oxidoreductase [Thermus]|jgi:ureidoglycolate dehydrogenase (NAD+)|uniref:Malate/L-lactate dehydrogenase family protein n=2 Tax=Thermus brockianus TaxID=56956 RepID=A0A1J0LQF9_THEBO|nr:Ldh family oxidoreductase [Thermus brockianus]APD08282.1 malate/L-lactate dehydrogenase family protein [Thermus brockianus]